MHVSWNHTMSGHRFLKLMAASLLLACASCQATPLVYYGGPVISNADVVMVNWGTNVPAGTQTKLSSFYADIVQSDYWTIMRQYRTDILAHDGGAGTNQQIGFGAFHGAYTITPAKCAGTTACSLSSTDINTELTNQILAGHLPAPTADAGGNANTVYMLHFHVSVTVTVGPVITCVNACSISTNFVYAGLTVPAGIIPDQSGACFGGCSADPSYLQAATRVTSIKLADLVTDAQLGLAAAVGRPLAWYDSTRGEIGCSSSVSADIVANGNTYTVGKLWSNQAAACITDDGMFVVKPSAAANGAIAPSAMQAVVSGATTSFTVTPDSGYTAKVTGSCGGALVGSVYTTNAITADCTVTASFIDTVFASGFEAP